MSQNLVVLMEKKNQTNYKQGILAVSKDSSSNKFACDWKRENGGRNQGNEANKKFNQSKSNVAFDDRRPRQRGYVGKNQKEEMKKTPQLGGLEVSNDAILTNDGVDGRSHVFKNTNYVNNPCYRGERSARYAGAKSGYKRTSRVSYKERFLQANCQFVVKPDADYECYATDPDLLIDWDLILQVRLSVYDLPSCPICLYPPRAAKITKCGHVYCLPCMLHYISLSSECDSWSKCPVCCERVYEKDMKSVKVSEVTKYKPGMKITMKLMNKARGDAVVFPGIHAGNRNTLTSVRDYEKASHAKLLTADDEYLKEMVESDRLELMEMMGEEVSDSIGTQFILYALELNEATAGSCEGLLRKNEPKETISAPISNHVNLLTTTSYASAFDEEIITEKAIQPTEDVSSFGLAAASSSLESDVSDVSAMCDHVHNDSASSSAAASELIMPLKEEIGNLKYFYQAADGQHIYMHSLNVRCLKAEYSSLELCPKEVVAEIVDMEDLSMNEESRHHFSYLTHLPSSCQFKIVELDLQPPLISTGNLKAAEELIRRRKKERELRDKRDENNAAKIDKIVNRMMGYDPDTKIVASDFYKRQDEEISRKDLTISHHFPEIGKPDGDKGACGGPKALDGTRNKKHADDESSGISFSQMLKAGRAKPFTKPQIPVSQPKVRTVDSDDDEEEGTIGEVPDFSESWSIDLMKKLDETLLSKTKGDVKDSQKKKKNKKGTLLFATGAVCPRSK